MNKQQIDVLDRNYIDKYLSMSLKNLSNDNESNLYQQEIIVKKKFFCTIESNDQLDLIDEIKAFVCYREWFDVDLK